METNIFLELRKGSRSLNKDVDKVKFKHCLPWSSLVVQWLRIHLLMQGTRVWALVQEDPTCCRATRARVPQLLKPECLEPVLRNKRSHRHEKSLRTTMKSSPGSRQLEKSRTQQRRPNAAKNNKNLKKILKKTPLPTFNDQFKVRYKARVQ